MAYLAHLMSASNLSPLILGFGRASIDHIALVDRFPEAGGRTEMMEFSIQGSGTVSTALATAAFFGLPTRYVGKVADDDFGKFAREGFEAMNVDLRYAIDDRGGITPYQFLVVDAETGKTTVLSLMGDREPIDPEKFDPTSLDGATMLLLDGSHVHAQLVAAEEAQKREIPVVLTLEHLADGSGELIHYADAFVVSERCAAEIASWEELEDCLIELTKLGPKQVVITLGEEGCIGLEGKKVVRQGPPTIDVIDTLGAGDVFLGAFCVGLTKGWAFEKILPFATTAASLSCENLGTRAVMPTIEDIFSVTDEHQRP